jgi:hypothetical protein
LLAVGVVSRHAALLGSTELTARAATAASLICDGPAAVYLLAENSAIVRAATHRLEPDLWPLLPQVVFANALPTVHEALAVGRRITLSHAMAVDRDERALLKRAAPRG